MKLKNAVAAALLMVSVGSVHAVRPGDITDPTPIVKIYPPPLGGGGANVNDIVFKNIVVQHIVGTVHPPIKLDNNWDTWYMNLPTMPGNPYVEAHPDPSNYRPRGVITNVLFKNIDVLQCDACSAVFMADAAVSPISGIVLDNVTLMGKALTPGSPNILTNQWVAPPIVRSDDLGRCRDDDHRICGSGMDSDRERR
jgi:hypothetical protein